MFVSLFPVFALRPLYILPLFHYWVHSENRQKSKMPLRLQNTKIHKEQTTIILYLVSSLSLRAFACPVRKNDCTGVAIKVFWTECILPLFHYSIFFIVIKQKRCPWTGHLLLIYIVKDTYKPLICLASFDLRFAALFLWIWLFPESLSIFEITSGYSLSAVFLSVVSRNFFIALRTVFA